MAAAARGAVIVHARQRVRAADLFSELRRDLAGPAHDFAASVIAGKN